jgi:hypothetical protein
VDLSSISSEIQILMHIEVWEFILRTPLPLANDPRPHSYLHIEISRTCRVSVIIPVVRCRVNYVY